MMETEDIALVDDVPEADAVEQQVIVDPDDERGLCTADIADAWDRDANQADLIDQAIIVSLPDDYPIQ